MKRPHHWIVLFSLVASYVPVAAAQTHSGMQMPQAELQNASPEEAPVKLHSGLGSLHHPIATKSAEAQEFFDQGLTLVYAFNFAEAARYFRRASELDPQAPMPYWGLALALGPNYNGSYVSSDNEKAAVEALQHAAQLAAAGPENERAYIAALAKRFT
ncbi:MAG: hypothetical protein ACRD5L_13825, partial [Bryobacteraceae bacterium]